MNLTYKTYRYLTRGYTVMTLIAFACILACVAVTDLCSTSPTRMMG